MSAPTSSPAKTAFEEKLEELNEDLWTLNADFKRDSEQIEFEIENLEEKLRELEFDDRNYDKLDNSPSRKKLRSKINKIFSRMDILKSDYLWLENQLFIESNKVNSEILLIQHKMRFTAVLEQLAH